MGPGVSGLEYLVQRVVIEGDVGVRGSNAECPPGKIGIAGGVFVWKNGATPGGAWPRQDDQRFWNFSIVKVLPTNVDAGIWLVCVDEVPHSITWH